MATFKVKFRQSSVEGKEGKIYYRFIYNREVKQFKTNYKLFPEEWDDSACKVVCNEAHNETRIRYLHELQSKINSDLVRMKYCFSYAITLPKGFDMNVFVEFYEKRICSKYNFFSYMRNLIKNSYSTGKMRRCEIYSTTLNSFMRFCKTENISFGDITPMLLKSYENYLKQFVSANTSSFYMRNLRAVYNKAVDDGLTEQNNPFKRVYTGIDKTVKRAVSIKVIKRLKELQLSDKPNLEFARDIFLFSFYTRGMSFVDVAHLKKSDLCHGVLTYNRKKTGQRISVKWEKCMQEIVQRHGCSDSEYMFPFVRNFIDYRCISSRINKNLRLVSEMLRLSRPITLYVARHAWASIAYSKNIPLKVISKGMGHDSENTTRIYLSTMNSLAVDRANKFILSEL